LVFDLTGEDHGSSRCAAEDRGIGSVDRHGIAVVVEDFREHDDGTAVVPGTESRSVGRRPRLLSSCGTAERTGRASGGAYDERRVLAAEAEGVDE